MKPDLSSLRGAVLAVSIGATGLLAIPASAAAANSTGNADVTFGITGVATGASNVRLFADAVQANGDVVAVGESLDKNATPTLFVERLLPNGLPDVTFGSAGVIHGPTVSGAAGTVAHAVAIAPDGKIVVVGQGTGSGGIGNDGMLVERFTATGALDTSFGAGGVQNIDPNNQSAGNAVALEPNGDILVGGSVDLNAVPYAAVARLHSTGSLDQSFGTLGVSVLQLGQYASVHALAPASNGSTIVGGSSSPDGRSTDGVVARITSTGTLDTTFNGSGAIVDQYAQGTGAFSSVNGVAVAANGTVYATGNATGDGEVAYTFLASYTSSGAKNGSFGSSGIADTPSADRWIGTGSDIPGANSLLMLPNGDLVVAGEYDDSTANTYGTLWSFTPTGQLDPSFGTNGVQLLKFANSNNSSFGGVAVSPTTGDLVAAGTEGPLGGTPSAVVAAFHGYTGSGTSTGPGSGTGTTPPPKPVALKLGIRGVDKKYSARRLVHGGYKVSVSCNQACILSLRVSTSAGTARHLDLKTHVRTCRKVRRRERCTWSYQFRPFVTSSGARLWRSGTHTFTLRLTGALARAIQKHPNTIWNVQVIARPTAKGVRIVTFKKNVQFTR